MATVQARALKRAVEIAGGIDALSSHVGEPRHRLKWWMGNDRIAPADVFLKIVDVICEHEVAELRAGREPATTAITRKS